MSWDSSKYVDSRYIIDTFPRWILLFSFLFSISRTFWNFKVGGILTSYLRYMLLLIQILKGKLEKIPNQAHYGGKGSYFNTQFLTQNF